ncbi:N-acetylmuramoyl-L-alanine amidase [Lentibacillus sp. CBA3610]|uniref:N-acetylmuramoyl-L-alanine amidase family protein n=1 Tax=Lentibacillus sp. CBA3610 TaxID=2518176 RepID=UPI001595F060|nr:N-acetylmuramoyl-L-alanine amidase [Lentibacillus sp. CBA3610]QKY71238.1 N-acetylmuramoyl-L-alanine amidase [Lentibacillus sp. CBA3610]
MVFQQKNGRNHRTRNMLVVTLLIFPILILSACSGNSDNNNNAKDSSNNSKNKNTAFKVVIDPGHGGEDNGATGASGQYEKSFTLSLAKKVEKLLEQESEMEVFMTRTDDSFISQESRYRPKYANKLNADVFVSIHGNTFSNPSVSGTETFYYHNNSRQFAQILQKHVVKSTGFRDRGIKKKDLFVVRDTEMPAALIEVGYLTNPSDESEMRTDDLQSRVAASIVEGIKEYKEQSDEQGFLNGVF